MVLLFFAFAVKLPLSFLYLVTRSARWSTYSRSVILAALFLSLWLWYLRILLPIFPSVSASSILAITLILLVYDICCLTAMRQLTLKKSCLFFYCSLCHTLLLAFLFISSRSRFAILAMLRMGLYLRSFFCCGFLYSRIKHEI